MQNRFRTLEQNRTAVFDNKCNEVFHCSTDADAIRVRDKMEAMHNTIDILQNKVKELENKDAKC